MKRSFLEAGCILKKQMVELLMASGVGVRALLKPITQVNNCKS